MKEKLQVFDTEERTLEHLEGAIDAHLEDDDDEVECNFCDYYANMERIPRRANIQELAKEMYDKGWRYAISDYYAMEALACVSCMKDGVKCE